MGGKGSGKRPGNYMTQKYTEANNDGLAKGKVGTLDEIGAKEGIERVTENDFAKAAELEAFMNEMLTVVVHPAAAAEEGALEIILPNVNGLNQPIIRGKEQNIKRKYVEVLARCRTTKYVQKVPDLTRPENVQMEEKTALTYPFVVIKDPNPNGREWLKAILAQP